MLELHWSVDSLVFRDQNLFGFGWAFHVKEDIQSLGFNVSLDNGDDTSDVFVLAESGKAREDVAHAFLRSPTALNSGFVVFGGLPSGTLVSVSLKVTLSSGCVHTFPVQLSTLTQFNGRDEHGSRRLIYKQFSAFFLRALRLFRAGQFRLLYEKTKRYLRDRPKDSIQTSGDLVRILTADERKNVTLIVDHDLGGGANHYRHRMASAKVNSGETILILTFHVATLSHFLIIQNSRINSRVLIPNKSFMLELLRVISVNEVVYNTAVSFVRPEEIPDLLFRIKQATGARLKVLAHDFFPVCPSHFLLDYQGNYCHIPDPAICKGCLAKNQQGFASLFSSRDIGAWRAAWGRMLSFADEIVTFSSSTATLLKKAYPQIENSQLMVVPHTAEYFRKNIPVINKGDMLCIGVVGQIGFHKGSLVVQSLAQEIKRRGISIRIAVIGTVEASCDSSIVSQTGVYKHDELPGLIESSGVNVMLFPSIWPETFSYVVQELMAMDLPVVCFNFGAPAERVMGYSKGLVIQSLDSSELLDQLILFHRKLYLAN